MQAFLLPYIVQGQPKQNLFARVAGIDIIDAADKACRQIRESYAKKLGHPVMVAVAEIDYTWLDRITGKPIPRPAAQKVRRRRRGW